jgi:hypothetical protein
MDVVKGERLSRSKREREREGEKTSKVRRSPSWFLYIATSGWIGSRRRRRRRKEKKEGNPGAPMELF